MKILAIMLVLAGLGVFLLVSPRPSESESNPELVREEISNQPPPSLSAAPERISAVAPGGGLSGERTLRFRNPEDLQKATETIASLGGSVEGIIPALLTLRAVFPSEEAANQALQALPATLETGRNFPVRKPPESEDPVQEAGLYVGFGPHALEWLGVPADNQTWGNGVQVAVLDTLITPEAGLAKVQTFDFLESAGGVPSGDVEHGTAVATLLAGTSPDHRGISPGSSVLGYRVLDESGVGDSFTVAAAIVDAVNRGAKVINMSLGSPGDSPVLRSAVEYALSRNVSVVAAAGNEGSTAVSYPAAYPGVIGVTAVDATGQRGSFANSGQGVLVAAPGIGLPLPGIDPREQSFSGTSAATPFVSGMVSQLYSTDPGMTPSKAAEILRSHADDAGPPGFDSYYGAGVMNASRIQQRNQPGIADLAIADFHIDQTRWTQSQVPIQVTVQNRGTTRLSNSSLEVTYGGQTRLFPLGNLAPNGVEFREVLIHPSVLTGPEGLQIRTRLIHPGDTNPKNDSRSAVLKLSGN